MYNSLNEFYSGLTNLETYLDGIEKTKKLISSKEIEINLSTSFKTKFEAVQNYYKSFGSRKVLEYNTIIISLYGFFERFLEDLIKDYINRLNIIVPCVKDLPKKIQKNNFELSADLLKRLNMSKINGTTTKDEIIACLYSCTGDKKKFKVCADAYTHHSSNFRVKSINDFFSNVGISNISTKIKERSQFIDYIMREFDLNNVDTVSQMREEVLFSKIDTLALLRNDVAHGVKSQTLSFNLYVDYIKFFKIYANAICSVLEESMLSYEIKYNSIKLKKAIKVHNSEILCINLVNTSVKKGAKIVAEIVDGKAYRYKYGQIIDIKIGNQHYENVADNVNVDVGLKVDFKIKENYQFYLIN